MPARWAGYLEKAAKDGDVTACRHYWELCVLMALRDGLRSGDVYVPGSRRYADPSSFFLTPQQWEPRRLEFCRAAGKPASAAEALTLASASWPCAASFVIGDRIRRLVTYGDDSAVARPAISAQLFVGVAGPGRDGSEPGS